MVITGAGRSLPRLEDGLPDPPPDTARKPAVEPEPERARPPVAALGFSG